MAIMLIAIAGCQGKPSLPAPVEAPGIHNLYRVSERIYSGSSPEGDAGFAALQKLGIKTIVSVDGAKPEVAAAQKHGLKYVHLPFGYDGIPRERIVALAKAAATCDGPLFVHCHHGKHRGPTAVAVMMMCVDPSWTAERAATWQRLAGTDPRYTGLLALPKTLMKPSPQELSALTGELPSIVAVPDLARIMVEMDVRWDHLKAVKAAGWKAPQDHPDIDPPHEALQLVEQYRESARLEFVSKKDPLFLQWLREGETAALELEQSLRQKPFDAQRAATAFARSASLCAKCHERFRDRPLAP